MYAIGPVSGASLFQILCEKLLAVRRRHACLAPLYVMTSPATQAETREFFAARENFGLPPDDVLIFCQGEMPAVDAASGRVLLAAPGQIALSPDGHGGLLAALRKSGALADIHRRGIRHLFYMQVDNPLAAVCDEEFLGIHALAGSELSTQVVAKRTPADRVGNVVQVDGVTRIIEYSDLPSEAGERRRPDGELELWAGNIAVHAFDVELLARLSGGGVALPFHKAHKKVPYVDAADPQAKQVEPAETNAIKFEQFIFDLLPEARRTIVVEVAEAAAFAPLKNGVGANKDSPEIVRAAMVALHASWLRGAGVDVAPGTAVEISPLWALDAHDVARRVGPNMKIHAPTYLTPF
jgi:UDP-N-acetylglucosamine/UDP-N-acetylgalactosamine diphosphorylase